VSQYSILPDAEVLAVLYPMCQVLNCISDNAVLCSCVNMTKMYCVDFELLQILSGGGGTGGTALQVGRSRDRFPVSPGFLPCYLTDPCALGPSQPLKVSNRITLGVKAAGV